MNQLSELQKALERIKKCGGDCKNCKHHHIKTARVPNGVAFAFYCSKVGKYVVDNYNFLSNSTSTLKADTIESIEFELS